MSKFKSAHRTIVTEVRSFIVDSVSRVGAFRQAVSAKVGDEDTLRNLDINVSKTKGFTLPETKQVVEIHSPEPIRIVMNQTGAPTLPSDPPPPEEYHTGVVVAASELLIGSPLAVLVVDADIPIAQITLQVVVFNLDTGETEFVDLERSSIDTFSGSVPTIRSVEKGTDFDGVIGCLHNQQLRVTYPDRQLQSGEPGNIEVFVSAISPFVDSRLTTNAHIFPSRPIAVMVEDADLTGAGTVVAQIANLTTGELEELTLVETTSGVFSGTLPTVIIDSSLSNDGKLEVAVGDQIEVTFTDENAVLEATKTSIIEVKVSENSNGVITLPTEVSQNAVLDLVLYDYDLAGVAFVDVPVSNQRTGEFEMVRCTETLVGSGVFEGQLQLTEGPTSDNDGSLTVLVGDQIRAVYVDGTAEEGLSPLLLEALAPIIADPVVVEDDPTPTPTPDPTPDPGTGDDTATTVEFISNGLYILNGSFNGMVSIYGLNEDYTRCSVLHV